MRARMSLQLSPHFRTSGLCQRCDPVREVAGGEVAAARLVFKRRLDLATDILGDWAARMEATALGDVNWAGQIAFEDDAFAMALDARIGDWYSREQRHRVRVKRVDEEVRPVGDLHQLA